MGGTASDSATAITASTTAAAGASGFDFLPSVLDDTFPVYSGLFNEVFVASQISFRFSLRSVRNRWIISSGKLSGYK